MEDDGNPRLCDFGGSKFIDDRDYNMPFTGSARYMAPELTEVEDEFNFDPDFEVPKPPPNCTKSTDIFAFSMVALEVSGLPYFYSGMFFGILCERWFRLTSLLCQPVVWWLIFSYFEQILTGKVPFYDSHLNDLVMVQIQNCERPERAMYPPTTFTDPMWNLLIDCWDQDPKRRPDMGTVVQHLQHMWWAVCFQVILVFRFAFSCALVAL